MMGMLGYTQIDYQSPIMSKPGDTSDVLVLTSKLTLWGCNDCGLLVWDHQVHNRWHEQQRLERVRKRWWRR